MHCTRRAVLERALIIGDSGGIGAKLSTTLAARGVDITGLSRSRDAFDFAHPESVESRLAALEPPFDLILVASGQLCSSRDAPEKSLRELSATEMASQFAVNTIGPALVLRHAPRLMPRRSRSVFAALSARVGSISDNRAGGWYSYRASKAALNQIVHTGAIELARTHKQATCVALHPGTVATSFTRNYPGHQKVTPNRAAFNLLSVIDALHPDQTGGFFEATGAEVAW